MILRGFIAQEPGLQPRQKMDFTNPNVPGLIFQAQWHNVSFSVVNLSVFGVSNYVKLMYYRRPEMDIHMHTGCN